MPLALLVIISKASPLRAEVPLGPHPRQMAFMKLGQIVRTRRNPASQTI